MTNKPISQFIPNASELIYGCMGLGGGWNNNPITKADIHQAHTVVEAALENNINYFDHADIYTFGKAEQVFGEVLKTRTDRDKLIIQSKCGIRFEDEHGPKRYDLSGQWIEHSVNNSLAQLKTDYLDVLILHRPDPLMCPQEIASTYKKLKSQGKVRFLGVSNMQQHQIKAIQQGLSEPLILNQVEMSLLKNDWVEEGIYAGNAQGANINFTPGLIEFCQHKNIQLQAWGSLSQGLFSGADITGAETHIKNTYQLVQSLAAQYGTSAEAIVLAWLNRHPSNIQPVIGTTNTARIKACAQVSKIQLTAAHWYALYESVKGCELP